MYAIYFDFVLLPLEVNKVFEEIQTPFPYGFPEAGPVSTTRNRLLWPNMYMHNTQEGANVIKPFQRRRKANAREKHLNNLHMQAFSDSFFK